MNSALYEFLQLAAEAGFMEAISSESLDSQPICNMDPRDAFMVQRFANYPEQASESQLQSPNTG